MRLKLQLILYYGISKYKTNTVALHPWRGKGILRMNVGNVTTMASEGSECHPVINQNEVLVKTDRAIPESEYLRMTLHSHWSEYGPCIKEPFKIFLVTLDLPAEEKYS